MKIAVMQPYFLPYPGYFQLMAEVDRFVLLDDVSYRKRSWIHRNRILLGGGAHTLSLSLSDPSQNRTIAGTRLAPGGRWRDKLKRTLYHAYRRSPGFAGAFPLAESILDCREAGLASFLGHGLKAVTDYLGLPVRFLSSSELGTPPDRKGTERILHICHRLGATEYVNPPGGRRLYDERAFAARGVRLRFHEPRRELYEQFGGPFVPDLSVIDLLMFVPRREARRRIEAPPPPPGCAISASGPATGIFASGTPGSDGASRDGASPDTPAPDPGSR